MIVYANHAKCNPNVVTMHKLSTQNLLINDRTYKL